MQYSFRNTVLEYKAVSTVLLTFRARRCRKYFSVPICTRDGPHIPGATMQELVEIVTYMGHWISLAAETCIPESTICKLPRLIYTLLIRQETLDDSVGGTNERASLLACQMIR